MRLFVCLGALAFVASGLEWTQLNRAWARSDKFLLAVAFTVFLPVLFLQSLRFAWMLKAQSIPLGYWESLKLSCTGNFLNNFVPAGLVGGDVIKAYYVARHTAQKTEAITAVVLDRVVGLFVLALIALVGLCVTIDWEVRYLGWASGAVALVALVTFAAILLRRTDAVLSAKQWLRRAPGGEQLSRIKSATLQLHDRWPLTLAAVLATVVSHSVILSAFTVAAIALGMSSDFVVHFAFLAISLVVAAIPISPAGLGTMEAAMTFLYVREGMGDPEQVILLALCLRAIQLLWALPGGALFLTGACRPRPVNLPKLETNAVAEI
ncbi:MAG: lysylphosphatidylglycerol synthase transmembrane domain-containing protein [Phycisphaerae bacterium]|jgi:uncharacterized protein (TIRG00374 family)